MTLSIEYVDPAALLAAADLAMETIPSVDLFNASKHQKLRERWCAGMFGVGYAKHVAPCKVAVNESDARVDVDMFLRVGERDWEFQIAEVQEPGRKRGREYKEFASGTVRNVAYDDERGRRCGAAWLAEGVEQKRDKHYAASESLHLLVYANIPARGLEYADVLESMSQSQNDFASIWVVTSLDLCSVFSPDALGRIAGWGNVRGFGDYYESRDERRARRGTA